MFWYDKQLIEDDKIALAINNPGLIYGATVFTTLRVYEKSLSHRLTHWQQHCDRLKRSLTEFQWPFPDWQEVTKAAEALLQHYPILRIVVFPDGKLWVTGRFLPDDLEERQQQGINGWLADKALFQRPLADYKTGNYLTAWLALQEAQKQGAKEAILVDSKHTWLETSTGNLWGWKEDCFWTPPDDGRILPGIMRSQLLNYLQKLGITVNQTKKWTPNFIQSLEMIVYSNCGVEIIPFKTIFNSSQCLKFQSFSEALKLLKSYFSD